MPHPPWLEILDGVVPLLLAGSHKNVCCLTNCCHFNTLMNLGGGKKGQNDSFGSIKAECTCLGQTEQ